MSTTRRRAAKPPPGRASLGPGVIRENVSMPANTGADYEYRMVIEQKYKSAAENRKNLRIVAAAQLVYHMVSYIFMEAALARGQKEVGNSQQVNRPPVTYVIALVGAIAVGLASTALSSKNTKRTILLLKGYQACSVFLAGAALYILILYRNTMQVKHLPSGLAGRWLADATGWHSGVCVHFMQGLEVTLDMLGVLGQLAGAILANNLRVAIAPTKES